MKKIVLGLMLASSFTLAEASSLSIVGASSPFSFSGYDGQPKSVTGSEKWGKTGTLWADVAGVISFTYLGNESGYWDGFKFNIGSGVLTEADALGKTVSQAITAGKVGFSFTDDIGHNGVDHIFANGTPSSSAMGFAFLGNQVCPGGSATCNSGSKQFVFDHTATVASGPNTGSYNFDYILGFNDSYKGDADYDDYVVGVNFTPSPVPLPAAAWLFGSALLGFVSLSNRRKV